MSEWRYTSTNLGLSIRWQLVVNFTPGPLYSRWIEPPAPIGSHSRSGRCGRVKNFAPVRNRNPTVQLVACRYTD
jgi:hypothetical protein